VGLADSPLRDRMVFLVGAQRSGTNWLQRMLATHPDVVSLPGETQLFTVGIATLAASVQHGTVGSTSTASIYMDRTDFVAAARAFCDTALSGVADRLRPGAARVLERSPNHVEQLGLISAVYPDAWIVHIVRDGRDVARSLASQRWGPRTVGEAAALWASSVRAARAAAPGFGRYLEVRYEALLANPRVELQNVLRFLGVDSSPPTVDAALHEAGVAYNTDARRPEIGDGKWRAEWTRRDLAAFSRCAGDVLVELGYDPDPGTPGRRVLGLGEATRRLRRRPHGADVLSPPPRPHLPLEVRQRRVDALCAALSAGDVAAAAATLSDRARVRVVTVECDSQARAEQGRALLAAAAAAPGTTWGTQRRGDVHVAGAMFAVVLDHESKGVTTQRVVVAHFDADDVIDGVTVYRFPL
jgi:hypothetical protein